MNRVNYTITGCQNPTSIKQRFSVDGTPILCQLIKNKQNEFIVKDDSIGIMTMKWFSQMGFRNVTVCHLDESPRYNVKPPYKTVRFKNEDKLRKYIDNVEVTVIV